jgi:hypothetical protein
VLTRVGRYLEFVDPSGNGEIGIRPVTARWDGFNFATWEEVTSFGGLKAGPFSTLLYVVGRFYPDKLELSYLTLEMVDELGAKLAPAIGREYLDYAAAAARRRESEPTICSVSFIENENLVKQAEIFKCAYKEYQAIRSIANGIDHQLLIKQKLLSKMKRL